MARRASANFDAALERFQKSATSHKDDARECAIFAISHAAEHGDLLYADRFRQALSETKTLRVRSFVAWMVKYAPVQLVDGKFKGDPARGRLGKSETEPSMVDLEGAQAEDFWMVEIEDEVKNFGEEDLFKALDSTIKRFERDNVHLSERGQAKLKLVKTSVENIKNQKIEADKTQSKAA